MGVYKTMKENNIYISMHRSSSKEETDYFDLSDTITCSPKILCSILETTPTVTSLDDLLDYFLIQRIKCLTQLIPTIEDETNQEIIRQLSDAANEIAKKYSTGDIIKYINNEYEILFGKYKDGVAVISKDMRTAFTPLVEFCIKYQTGINDSVFLHLAENKFFIYVDYYDDLKKKLLTSWTLFDKVFSTDNILNMLRSHCKELLAIAKSVNESSVDEKIKPIINERLFNCIVDIMNNAIEREIIAYSDSVRRVRRYFSEIKFDQQKLARLEEAHSKFDERLTDWMKKTVAFFLTTFLSIWQRKY